MAQTRQNNGNKTTRHPQVNEAPRQLRKRTRPRQLAACIQRNMPPGLNIRLSNMVQRTKATLEDPTGCPGRSGKMDDGRLQDNTSNAAPPNNYHPPISYLSQNAL